MRVIALLALCGAVFAAEPAAPGRIAGGSVTTIDQHPYMALLFYFATNFNSFVQHCGGTIITSRSVLTATSCLRSAPGSNLRWRFRVGSSFASRGGVIHNVNEVIEHHDYGSQRDDIAILRTGTPMFFYDQVRAIPIAGRNYIVGDNELVWAAGWGLTANGSRSDELRHVELLTVNQTLCRERLTQFFNVKDEHVCSGWLSDEPLDSDQIRGQCAMDFGGPLIHNGVLVGIHIHTHSCGHSYFPSVNSLLSRYFAFIQTYA